MALLKTKTGNKKEKRLKNVLKEMTSPSKTKSLNLQLSADLLRRFKSKTAAEDVSMTEVLTKKIEDYVSS